MHRQDPTEEQLQQVDPLLWMGSEGPGTLPAQDSYQ